jgi:uncharacterized membrane protein YjgN (DUF898 family)
MTDVVAAPAIAPAIAPAEVASRVEFTGVRSEFWLLVVRGTILEFVTLGFYRFWLATDMRRHLWSHTSIGGDAAEYTGTAKELLLGFLFALAIIAPINLAYFFLSVEAELLAAFASVPLILFFYLFYQFAMYRARRYRLTRTVWRGVRFWMAGSGWSYAWRAALWSLASGLSGGLAMPWRQAALERYKMKHSFYGDVPGRFAGTADQLFEKFWPLWGAWVMLLIAPMITAVKQPLAGGILAVLALLVMPFLFAIYKAIEWRWWVSGIRFGDVRFESRLSAYALIGPYWKTIGWSILLLVLLFAWGVSGFFLAQAANGMKGMTAEVFAATIQQPIFLIILVIGYVICALIAGVVLRLYLGRDVWERVVASTVVYNLAAADNVTARGEVAGSLGEGLADGLGGGF